MKILSWILKAAFGMTSHYPKPRQVTFNEDISFKIIEPIFLKKIHVRNPPYYDLDKLYLTVIDKVLDESLEILDHSVHMYYLEICSEERRARKEIKKRCGLFSDIENSMRRELVRDINFRKDLILQELLVYGENLGSVAPELVLAISLDIDIPIKTLLCMRSEYDSIIKFYRSI
jgi:hypothetical protein